MERNNFYFLFAGLLIFLGVEPFLGNGPRAGALIQLAFTSIMIFGVFSLAFNQIVFRVGIGLAALCVAGSIGYWFTGLLPVRVFNLLAIAAFVVLGVGVTLRQVVLTPGAVTLNRVVGALCLYLLLGVLWTVAYGLVELFAPGAFQYASNDGGDALEHFLYYSFVTLTTLGYGDLTPLHPVARTLAYLEAVVGQLYVAVLVASLVGRHSAALGSGTEG